MSGNIKTIKFTAKMSVFFVLFTYIVDRNIELAFFAPNWKVISNNFVFTVCGGIFVSTIFAMLFELHKYWSNKVNCQQYLFYQTMYLYVALFQMIKNIEEYITKKDEPVPGNLLVIPLQNIQCQIKAIQGTDYTTFSSKDKLMLAQQKFCTGKLMDVNGILQFGNYFNIAFIKTQKSNLMKFGCDKSITSADELIFKTLSIIDKQCRPLLDEISGYLEIIDQTCNNKYGWKNMQNKIHKSYISIFKTDSFDDFIKQGG